MGGQALMWTSVIVVVRLSSVHKLVWDAHGPGQEGSAAGDKIAKNFIGAHLPTISDISELLQLHPAAVWKEI